MYVLLCCYVAGTESIRSFIHSTFDLIELQPFPTLFSSFKIYSNTARALYAIENDWDMWLKEMSFQRQLFIPSSQFQQMWVIFYT